VSPELDLSSIAVISRAVVTPQPLEMTLSTIARAAAGLLGADAAIILLRDGLDSVRFAGGYGMSPSYRANFDADQHDMPVVEALRTGRPILFEDTEHDTRFVAWRDIARAERFRALVALPLTLGDAPLGTLAVYRRAAGPWGTDAVDALNVVGAYIATAVRTAHLIDEQQHMLAAHARVLHGLREQAWSNMERIAHVQSSLDRGDGEDVGRLVAELQTQLSETYAAVVERIDDRVVASMLIGEASIAARKRVTFRLDRRSRLTALPAQLGTIEAVSLVSNLLENAFDAATGLPAARRRATLLVRSDHVRARLRVRDWGIGLDGIDDEAVLRHGFSTKPGHSGVGLAIVAELVRAAGGRLTIDRPPVGATFTVEIGDV
jgi:signal transduction histidine kinase